MSQETVAFVVERLLTDRNFRNEFALEPLNTLIGVQREGRELTSAETVALVQADRKMWFWPDEKQGLETLRNVLVAFEKNRARQSSLHAAARIAANAARPAGEEGGDRIAPPVPALTAVEGPALSLVEGPRSWVFDGGGSPTTDQSLPARRRGVRWLLLALLCFVLAFVLGFATGIAHAAPPARLSCSA